MRVPLPLQLVLPDCPRLLAAVALLPRGPLEPVLLPLMAGPMMPRVRYLRMPWGLAVLAEVGQAFPIVARQLAAVGPTGPVLLQYPRMPELVWAAGPMLAVVLERAAGPMLLAGLES